MEAGPNGGYTRFTSFLLDAKTTGGSADLPTRTPYVLEREIEKPLVNRGVIKLGNSAKKNVECGDTKPGGGPQRGDEKPEWRPRKLQSPLGLRSTFLHQSAAGSSLVASPRDQSRDTRRYSGYFRETNPRRS
ncbi:hypothetical protein KM043_001401 [Ampulex compressa]|nr:hypothetical protein KM043_001401 [Ampulex compressa]